MALKTRLTGVESPTHRQRERYPETEEEQTETTAQREIEAEKEIEGERE